MFATYQEFESLFIGITKNSHWMVFDNTVHSINPYDGIVYFDSSKLSK